MNALLRRPASTALCASLCCFFQSSLCKYITSEGCRWYDWYMRIVAAARSHSQLAHPAAPDLAFRPSEFSVILTKSFASLIEQGIATAFLFISPVWIWERCLHQSLHALTITLASNQCQPAGQPALHSLVWVILPDWQGSKGRREPSTSSLSATPSTTKSPCSPLSNQTLCFCWILSILSCTKANGPLS